MRVQLRERRGDVVVTDIAMPHMDGLALVAALRSRPETQDLPVVFVSSPVDADTIHFAEQERATLLAKPVARQRLADALSRIGDATSGAEPGPPTRK